ncbi:MAG: 50S ribosomal protein L19e [Candidatus Micrarchaeia archaeon]
MVSIQTVKRLAADILKAGVNRVRIKTSLDENQKKQLEEAITRLNVRDLIKDKIVYCIPKKGRLKKEKRKSKSRGTRRGKKYSIVSEKERWMEKVRAQRKYLRELVMQKKIEPKNKRMIYLKIKGGSFRNKQAIFVYLKDNKLLLKE